MTNTQKYTKAGSMSAYALACGYRDIVTRELENGGRVDVILSHNGCTYDVKLSGETIAPKRLELPNGAKIIAGWAQFDKLTDARRFQRRLLSSRIRTVDDAYAHCLAVMS